VRSRLALTLVSAYVGSKGVPSLMRSFLSVEIDGHEPLGQLRDPRR